MSGMHELDRDIDVDLGGVFATLWRKKAMLLLVSIAATALAFVVLMFVSPKYKSETQIHIESRDPVLSRTGNDNSEQQRATLDQEGVASQVRILSSRDIARTVVRQLDLAGKPEFDSALSSSFATDLLVQLGLTNDPTDVSHEERVLKTFYEKLKIYQAERTRIIVVEFSSKDPEIAAAVPNAIAAEYLRIQEEYKRGFNPEELKNAEPELNLLRKKVKDAEARVARYRSSSDLLSGRDNVSLATQQLGDLTNELASVRSERSSAVSRAQAIRRVLQEGGSIGSLSNVLDSPLIQRLRERQVGVQSRIADLSTSLLSGHPRIQSLRSQAKSIDAQIRNEAEKVLSSLNSDARIAKARENDLVAAVNTLKAESSRVGEAQVELRALEREANAQSELLNAYLLRFGEAKSRQNREFLPADARVTERATVQYEPYFPKKLPILAATFFGTLLASAMVVLAGGLMAARAVGSPQVRPDYPYREEPEVPSEDEQIEHDDTKGVVGDTTTAEQTVLPFPERAKPAEDADSEEFAESGAAMVVQTIAQLGKARVAHLSPEGRDGSQCTVLLARYLASQGFSVLVVDMTGESASSRAMIGPHLMPGIKDLLAGSASFDDVIHSDVNSHAHIIPSGIASNSRAASASDRLYMIFDALEETYDYLLIDCGAADVSALARISRPNTFNVINAVKLGEADIRATGEAMVEAGYRAPLTLNPSVQERRMMGTCAA